MKAIVCPRYGPPDVLEFREVERPVAGNNEVLIKMCASTVTKGDCELRGLTLPLWTRIPVRLYMGYRKPKNFIPGMEFSGIVESVGSDVTAFKNGDHVFGSTGFRMGANAEYNCYPDSYTIVPKPSAITHEEAAAIPVGGLNGLHFIRKAEIKPGQKVLINGAGGSIGTFGLQLAKLSGAVVTAVDSTAKLDMMRALGADHVIDYTRNNFGENGERYDVIFDTVYESSFSRCIRCLKQQGRYLMANPSPSKMLRGLYISKTKQKKVIFKFAKEKAEDLIYLANLVASGKIKPVIDRHYPLQHVAHAHDYVEKGHKKGIVIIRNNP